MNRTFLAFLIALLIISPVSAELIVNRYTNDFTASSPTNEQIKICSCEARVDRIIVENTGNFYADFNVRVQGSYPRTIRVPNADFQLAPGHFEEVLIYIEDSCGVEGVFDYDVVVTNSYGRTQHVTRSIRSDVCQTSALDVTPISQEVGLCKPAIFKVTATNAGTFADTFTLDFGQFNDVAKAKTEFYLDAREAYTQNVSFTFPCDQYGTRTIPFTLLTSKNGPGAQVWRDIVIMNEYDYSIDLPSSIDACAQSTTNIPVTIRNQAGAPDEIHIDLDAPQFVTLDHDVSLGAGEAKNATLAVYAPRGSQGQYPVVISTADRFGNVQKQRELQLNVNNCYDAAVELRVTPTEVMETPLSACCGEKTYYVNLKNNGDRSQTFQLKVEGPSIFALDETTIRLDPAQNANIPVRADLPCTDNEYAARIIAWPTGAPQANVSAQIIINSQTQRTCHMVQIDDDEIEIGTETTVIPVMVKHTGSEGGLYRITSNNTVFGINETNITLAPGDQRAIHIVPLANLSGQELGRYILRPTFTVEQIDYNEAVGIELEGKGIFERFMDWLASIQWSAIGFCGWIILILLLLVIAAAALLTAIYMGMPFIAEGLPRKTLTLLKLILLLLVVVALIIMAFLRAPTAEMRYERVAQTTDSTTIEMYQNTQKTVDIAQYFEDPDRDTLVYTVTQPSDIAATIEGAMLTLTPDHNFAGENTLVITASDERGGITDSPVFVIRVIRQKDLSFWQWLEAWCGFIQLGLVILLLLLLFLIVLTIKEYRSKPFANNNLVIIEKPVSRARASRSSASRPARASSRAARGSRGSSGSRALVVNAVPARGRQVPMARATSRAPVVREFRGSGQTVNIAVGAQPQAPAIVAVPGAKQNEVIYVGSKSGNTVHTPYCMIARRIPKNKRLPYSSKREAVKAGLVPCKMCRPFEGGI
jgi:hypothetical protein